MPEVSVITPSNRSDSNLLRRAAHSIASQNVDLEWVVVTTGAVEVIEALAAEYSISATVILHSPTSDSPGPARNQGLSAVASPFVASLDDDDELPLNSLRVQLDAIATHAAQWSVGMGEVVRHGGVVEVVGLPVPSGRVEAGVLARITKETGKLPTIPSAAVYATDILRQVGGWPELAVDEDTFVKLALTSSAAGVAVDCLTYRYFRDRLDHQSQAYALDIRACRSAVVERLQELAETMPLELDHDASWHRYVDG
jgi:glycosyltransferase involved in cell wall biosynthesis